MNGDLELDDADRGFKQSLRDAASRDYMPSPVLDEHQWEIDRLLRQMLPAAKWQLFAGSCLTAFFDPEQDRPGLRGYQDIVFEGSVLFAVVTSTPNTAAVLVVIEPNQPRLESFLARSGVDWIPYSTVLSPQEFAEKIAATVEGGTRSRIGERSPLKLSEFQVARELKAHTRFEWESQPDALKISARGRKHLAEVTPRVLHEVAIHRFMPKLGHALSKQATHMARISSVDILMHGRGKSNWPLLAIEIDGGVHESPQKIAKDRAKDEVMDAIRIPLIRITPSDADFWSWKGVENLPRTSRDNLKRFVALLSQVASDICWQVQLENHYALDQDKATKSFQVVQEEVARSIFGLRYVDLNDSQEVVVLESLMASWELHDEEMPWQLFNYDKDNAIDEAKADSDWPDDLQLHATFPEVLGNLQLGLTARTMVTVQGSRPIQVETASIRVMASKLDQELLSIAINRRLIQAAAGLAREKQRMLTPARRS